MKKLLMMLMLAVSANAFAITNNEISKSDILILEKSTTPADQAFLAAVIKKEPLQVCDEVYKARKKQKSIITENYKYWAIKYLAAIEVLDMNNDNNTNAIVENNLKFGINACTVRIMYGPPTKVTVVDNDDGTRIVQYQYKSKSIFMQTNDTEQNATVRIAQ